MGERAATRTPRRMTEHGPGPLRIAAVIPALNEAPSIGQVVDGLRSQTETTIHQIIVVDNGSNDETAAIAQDAGAIVVAEPRRGYGFACRAGVLAATDADVIVLLDGDAADDPADLQAVLSPVLAGTADLVVGSRSLGTLERGAMTPIQVFGNGLAATIMRRLYGVRVSDLGPFRAIRRSDLLGLEMREMTYGWSVEMMVKAARAGLRYQEVPVSYRRRIGVSKVSGTVTGSVRAGWCILSTTFRYCRWTATQTLPLAADASLSPGVVVTP